MYSHLTPGWRWLVKSSLASAWALVGLGGVSIVFQPPNRIIAEWPQWVATVGGWFLAGACLMAVFGVVFDRYRFEWLAAWLAASVFGPYVTTNWYVYFEGLPERQSGAFFSTALLICMLGRVASCGAHAARLRWEYEQTRQLLKALEDASTGQVRTVRRDDGAG